MRGVIFDMDGVLVLSGPAHFEAWRIAAAQDGIDLSFEEFSHTFGRTNPDVIRLIWKRELAPDRVAALAEAKERAYRDMVRASVPLAPGVRDALVSLAEAGLVMGVGSSAPRENLDLILDAGRLRVFFASVVDGSMVAKGKPAPDVFLLAARQAALEPSRCVVVEDAPAGVEAASAAGMRAVGVTTTHDADALRAAGATHIVPGVEGVTPDLVRRLVG